MNLGPNTRLGKHIVTNYGRSDPEDLLYYGRIDESSSQSDYPSPIVPHDPNKPLVLPKTQAEIAWDYVNTGYKFTSQAMDTAYHSISEQVAHWWVAFKDYWDNLNRQQNLHASLTYNKCWDCDAPLPNDYTELESAPKNRYCQACWKGHLQMIFKDIYNGIIYGDEG